MDKNSDFKVICDYCGSYVDAADNMICPNCGAPLEEAIINMQTRLRLERLEEQEALERNMKEMRDRQDRDEVFDFIKALAGTAAGAGIARSLAHVAGDFLKDDLKKSFRRK